MRLLLPFVLLLLAPTAAAQVIPLPQWTEGDVWEYATPGGGRVQHVVVARENLTIGNATESAWQVVSVERLADGTLVSRGSVWSRVSDGALLRESVTRTDGDTLSVAYDLPCLVTPFPLQVGKAWSVACSARVVETGDRVAVRYNASVREIADVRVPIGTFATMLVVRNGTDGDVREHWSSDACHFVRKDNGSGVLDLRGFKCASTGKSASVTPATPDATPSATPAGTPGPGAGLVLALCVAIAVATDRRRRRL